MLAFLHPFCGQRCSIVLFTHEACLRPLATHVLAVATALQVATTAPITLQQFEELGVRAKAKSVDWQFNSAIGEVAEATLEVADIPYSALVQHIRQDDDARAMPSASLRVPSVIVFSCS